ncbi:MAG: site-specific integrase [Bacteroidetes bacterium]|nr:site-specific integrase [Bacteroidota bacterium]
MSVKLREKKIKGGQISFYLDIYHNKARWYEFLDIHINSKKLNDDDKEKKRLASEIRTRREHELIVEDNGLIDKKKKNALFIPFFINHYKIRDENGKRRKECYTLYSSALSQIEAFAGKKPISIARITTEWMQEFEKFLLGRVSNNSALSYLKTISTALNEAVRKKIISSNPWHHVPRHERLKKQDIFRASLTLEQLQMLAETSCKIEPQIREGYFFSCFTGLRWSDVNPLMWKEIIIKSIEGVERWFLYFEQEKTEGIEYLPLSEQAIEILKQRKQEAKENNETSLYVFPLIKETELIYGYVHRRVNFALKEWAKAAKELFGDKFTITEKEMHFHNARHTFATNMLETGACGDILLVSKLLGHKSLQSTQVYAHVREQRKLNAVDGLPKINLQVVHRKKVA